MNLLGALAPFRGLAAARLRSASVRELVAIGGVTAGLLIVYCLGHAALTTVPIAPARSLVWSVAHGAGIAALLAAARHAPRHRPMRVLPLALLAGLGTGTLVLAVGGWLLVAQPVLPDYVTVSVYVAAAAALAWLVRPGAASEDLLMVDFGTARERVALDAVVAAHGARNYAELHLLGESREGLVRSTLTGLERDSRGRLVRVQRSWLVNPDHVRRVRQGPRAGLRLELAGGLEVPVSAPYAEAVLADPRFVPAAVDSSPGAGRSTA